MLATNGFAPLLRRLRYLMVPIYDYALVTEPLSTEQWDAVGWKRRMGVSDSANHFHYTRVTPDGRILWGGYDAIYHFGSRVRSECDVRDATFVKLARQFFELWPQLEGVRFTHAWGGVIDVSTPLLPVLRHGSRRPRLLRSRLHGHGGGRLALRRRGRARPGLR